MCRGLGIDELGEDKDEAIAKVSEAVTLDLHSGHARWDFRGKIRAFVIMLRSENDKHMVMEQVKQLGFLAVQQ